MASRYDPVIEGLERSKALLRIFLRDSMVVSGGVLAAVQRADFLCRVLLPIIDSSERNEDEVLAAVGQDLSLDYVREEYERGHLEDMVFLIDHLLAKVYDR